MGFSKASIYKPLSINKNNQIAAKYYILLANKKGSLYLYYLSRYGSYLNLSSSGGIYFLVLLLKLLEIKIVIRIVIRIVILPGLGRLGRLGGERLYYRACCP